MTTGDRLRKRIQDRTVRVAVIGCGYVGLPLAVSFARAGVHTTAIDLNADHVLEAHGVPGVPDGTTVTRRPAQPARSRAASRARSRESARVRMGRIPLYADARRCARGIAGAYPTNRITDAARSAPMMPLKMRRARSERRTR